MKGTFIFLIGCMLLVSLSSAVNMLACTSNSIEELITMSLQGLLAPLIFLTVFALAVLYMFATMFNKPEYILLVKDEFFHLAMSIALLVFFGTIMSVSCGLVGGAFDFAYQNLYQKANINDACYNTYSNSTVQKIAACYMEIMNRDAKQLINTYTKANIDLMIDASGYVSYYGLIGGVTFGPKAYKRTQAMFVDNLNNIFVIPAYVSIASQNIFMRYFVSNTEFNTSNNQPIPAILGFILPGAFLLRFFAATRQIGNMLIAFAIGAYLVVPFLIALNGIMYKYTFTTDQCKDNYENIISDPISILGDCNTNNNLLAVARLYPQAFLLPNLVIILFISFISSANKALRVLG